MNTNTEPNVSPRDLTEVELALIAGGWMWHLGGKQSDHFRHDHCSPNVTPACGTAR